jgi:hypothetical protein
MDFDLFKFLDTHITRARFEPNRCNDHLYPSEASVKFIDKYGDEVTEGGCLRASFFRVNGFEKKPHPAYTQWIFEMGNRVEQMIVDKIKESGIWVDNNIKFYNEEFNVSGEIDLLIAEPPTGVVVPCEIKSCYGYFAKKEIIGNTKQKGQPKLNQLVQLLVYLHEFRDQFPYGRMVYFFRDTTERKSFKIELHQDGKLIYPVVDGDIKNFTVNNIFARYKELQHYIDNNEVPPKDYELDYPEAKIHDFAKKGKVGKTKYQAFQKGKLKPYEHIGDWMCSYCGFSNHCYGDNICLPVKDHL